MKKHLKWIIPVAISVVLIIIVAGLLIYKKLAPNTEHMDLAKYFGASKDEVTIIMGDEISDSTGKYHDKMLYLKLDLVKEKLNDRFYWDSKENLLLYSTPNAVIYADPDSKDSFNNNSKVTKDYVIWYTEGDDVYVAADYVAEYTAVKYKVYQKPNRAVVTYEFGESKKYAKTEEECKLRVKANIKSKILVDLKEGDNLRLLGKKDKETGFCKVMSQTGVIGYVKASSLAKTYENVAETDFKPAEYSHILRDDKVSLLWHQVTNQSANGNLLNLLSSTKGVNVVSPTWFQTSDNKGNISSLASDTYVTQAHRAGVQVWGLCNDFAPDMKIGNVLGYTSRRQKLAKNLIAEAIRYSLDGINIDFENVREESGEDFIQFIRELSIMCRNNGIILSIDNYPLRNFNAYYDREEQAAVADYIITMAYDEYYAGSEEAGPVSSLSYVTDSIAALKDVVPDKQSIIALPFYSRHWTETTKKGKVELTSEACSMSYAQDIVKDSGAQKVWDDNAEMNYIEYKKGKKTCKMWIEDQTSLELKVKATADAKAGGVAFWKAGMESDGIWDMIVKYNK